MPSFSLGVCAQLRNQVDCEAWALEAGPLVRYSLGSCKTIWNMASWHEPRPSEQGFFLYCATTNVSQEQATRDTSRP